jgi:photosystem II stability/assembly factor-like uncharacterized protein
MRRITLLKLLLVSTAILMPFGADAVAKEKKEDPKDEGVLKSATFSGLQLRCIGPALTSGRVGDFAVHPVKRHVYYVAVCSGNVWKTENSGTTWTPIFDDQGSYSIGCLALDESNPLVVWVGTGENNSQRSVAYGDGVYKSIDGGKTWRNVGLKESEHIGKILIDPRDSDTVWVAAQGPLWRAGGERGLYRTTDGGQTWTLSLEISEDTGVSDIAMDPRDPDVLYASAYQRRRHVWTLIDGGPEGAIYKTTDGGGTWDKLTNGLPKGDIGRIGLAVAPTQPDIVYAIVEATGEESGFYRSRDAGGSWEKMNGYLSSSPQYYQEIIADPRNPDRVYSLDTFMQVTEDGGRTWNRVGIKFKHVDDHALWIDPTETDHLLAGCDGGIYETWDRGETWEFKANLPVTQFYKITADNDAPFYNVYGGTQDNNTVGAPSRTTSASGIVNSDWTITLGGDGFEPQVDPQDPNIVYSQYQYGGLSRYDRRSGERLDIQPQERPGEDPPRWNWSSPLIISPHSPSRLYYACQRLYRSDDRGGSWRAISGDLTRGLDRNRLEVMGRIWGVDTVAKNRSTSFYGNIVSLSESPLQEGLLYAGTDDGLIQVSETGGQDWARHEAFKDVPEMAYVSYLTASRHEAGTVYAAFDNHKRGDFKPYVLKSSDRGRSWRSIAGDLPERGHVHAIVEDHVDPNLLFAGTEFGVFFTLDGGRKWIRLQGGMPVIACRDLEIQPRENDLIVGTFGRGIYILDDYTPLRGLSEERLQEETILFPVKTSWMYIESTPIGGREKGNQGDSYYTAPNPPSGTVITYYLKDDLQTRKEERQEREKKLREDKQPVYYPDWEVLRTEDREKKPAIILTITDADGEVVRRLTGPVGAGIHRVTWNLRYPAPDPTSLEPYSARTPWSREPQGPMVAPGTYTVSVAKSVRGEITPLSRPQSFETAPLGNSTLSAPDRRQALAFQQKVARLQRAVLGAVQAADEIASRIDHVAKALLETPAAAPELWDSARGLDLRLKDLLVDLEGDRTIASRSEPVPAPITDRVERIVSALWSSTSAPTETMRESYTDAAAGFATNLTALHALVADLRALEDILEAAGGPWTPGRLPTWQPE